MFLHGTNNVITLPLPLARIPYAAANSVPLKIRTEMDAMLAGKSYSEATARLFETNNRDTTTPNVTYNPDLWCEGKIDLSPISVIRDGQPADNFPVILVHERFVYAAKHIQAAGPYTFKRPDGGYETRTVLRWTDKFPEYTYTGVGDIIVTRSRDAAIGILSTPITTIEPAKLLPANFESYFLPGPAANYQLNGQRGIPTYYLPMLSRRARKTNGESFARIIVEAGDFYNITQDLRTVNAGLAGLSYVYPGEECIIQAAAGYESWHNEAIGGDSGSPHFWPWDGKMLLIGTLFSANAGPSLAYSYEQLEIGMNEIAAAEGVSGTFALSKLDLSSFYVYP